MRGEELRLRLAGERERLVHDGGDGQQHQHERVDEERRRVHAVFEEEHELDDEDGPGEERRGLGQVRERRVVRAHADRADPGGVADEARQHEHESRRLQPLPREERRQRHQRAGGVEAECEVEGQVGAHDANFLEKTILSHSMR